MADMLKKIGNVVSYFIKSFALILIKFYKHVIRPILPSSCRFYPTCSEYAEQAIKKHGIYRGGLLTVKRILRCHPWCEGGIDEVPN
jgi:uncharacterized protein